MMTPIEQIDNTSTTNPTAYGTNATAIITSLASNSPKPTSAFENREGITEQLKADNQLEWVRRMNNIRHRATEIINHDLIYA